MATLSGYGDNKLYSNENGEYERKPKLKIRNGRGPFTIQVRRASERAEERD